MPDHVNVLVFIHGIVTSGEIRSHTDEYQDFFDRLSAKRSELSDAFAAKIFVEWGHQTPESDPSNLRDDEKLRKAQNRSQELVSYQNVRDNSGPNNKLTSDWSWLFFLRGVLTTLKENTLLLGLGDAAYYGSEDGEIAVREAVYGQVLNGLEPFEDDNVRLHVSAHSLGCTVAFDFLFGLFAPGGMWDAGMPDFARTARTQEDKDRYMKWRSKAPDGTLLLGSKTSTASQLPLLLLRKQKVVDALAEGKDLDASVIGIKPTETQARWQVFYDIDDVLSFPTRPLFGDHPAVFDFQVDAGDRPDVAHVSYWKTGRVVEEVADLLASTTV